MNIKKKIVKLAKFAKLIHKNRWLINNLLDTNPENFRFIKYANLGHFYSPIPDFSEIKRNRKAYYEKDVESIFSIDINRGLQLEMLEHFKGYYDEMPFPEKATKYSRYYLDNAWFDYGDGIILYSFLRHFKPKKIIEIGSGFSSALMLETNERFFGNSIDITFIEPNPDRLLNLLKPEDRSRNRLMNKSVQEVRTDIFCELSENDILFIDSSHVAKIGSDVVHIVSNILPQLRPGVIIHFHDVLWPFEYPEKWLTDGRAWNEAYFLKSFLQYNNAFQIIYFNSYMEKCCKEVLQKKMPLVLRIPSSIVTPGNTSLWLKKTL